MLNFLRKISLTQWIMISMVVGMVIGWAFPTDHKEAAIASASVVGTLGTPHGQGPWVAAVALGSGKVDPYRQHILEAQSLKPLSNIFLRMIKSLITPLIFATLVIGIAGHGD